MVSFSKEFHIWITYKDSYIQVNKMPYYFLKTASFLYNSFSSALIFLGTAI